MSGDVGAATVRPDEALLVADDLSGAAEAAAALMAGGGAGVELRLLATGSPVPLEPVGPAAVPVIDTDSRYADPGEAARRVAAALAVRPAASVIVKKVDSLLRGPIAAELARIHASAGLLVFCAALPALGRATLGGVVHLRGVPLHETDAWAAERAAPPRDVRAALDGLEVQHVPLSAVRAGGLARVLGRVAETTAVAVCDAETEGDVQRIVDAALRQRDRAPVGLAGTSALARAVGRWLPPRAPDTGGAVESRAERGADRRVLVVAGTLASVIRDQLAALRPIGVEPVIARAITSGGLRGRIAEAWGDGVAAVRADGGDEWDRRALAALAAELCGVIAPEDDLVLTGGETARRVLEALGETQLRVCGEIEPGAVLSITVGGRRVVTRPGSYGGPESIANIVAALQGTSRTEPGGTPGRTSESESKGETCRSRDGASPSSR
ncbi:MAG TPA: four-carbon acid sugar kinase family protein [Gryllotalpicola sp.]